MGTNTAETPEVSTEEQPIVEIDPNESENAAEASEVSEGEEQQEATEVEVVLDGESGSQPDAQHGIRKRINKLNTKIDEANDTAAHAESALEIERQKNKILSLAVEQARTATATPPTPPPDPNDFDDGVRDPKYVKALDEFNEPRIAAAVQRQSANLPPAPVETIDRDLEQKQTKHYERASVLGAKDFEETEDKAIAILGNDAVNVIISNFEKSELILYYLGKNPEKAERVTQLIKDHPVMGVAELGRMEARLSAKPKSNLEPTPDPDEELPGGSPSAGKTNKHQRAVDAARAKAGETRDMKPLIAAKKAAKEAGVTVT